ncbi:hypothetical protein P154DRAFT_101021 [Amniculicola lignicola CBS 123094]|uniref:Uncharacterized protein n=1 Tax=Amniculicola lignicola CBS 123094 TaxID=1392246 RepID=A0A6A5WN23_9PLEO|nr:hypothetical protein P154DRAFT_101021 [Amniculicola lignicola CBS 123094]
MVSGILLSGMPALPACTADTSELLLRGGSCQRGAANPSFNTTTEVRRHSIEIISCQGYQTCETDGPRRRDASTRARCEGTPVASACQM